MTSKKVADLAGPGIGNYADVEKILPGNYSSLLTRRETQKAIFATKRYIEDKLCKELNLMMVTVPLDRGRRERRERHAGPRRFPNADPVPHHQRPATGTRSMRRSYRRPRSGRGWR